MRSIHLLASFLILTCLASCQKNISGNALAHNSQAHENGFASWYGPGFHGKTTASGEKYNMHKMTAAHKTLPFGSKVKVVRPDTGQSTVVTINDRGPFIKGRIIDLSFAAGKKINLQHDGVAQVQLFLLSGQGNISSSPVKMQKAPKKQAPMQDKSFNPIDIPVDTANVSHTYSAPASSPDQIQQYETVPEGQASLFASQKSASPQTTANIVYLQLASYTSMGNAQNHISKLSNPLRKKAQIVSNGTYFRVCLGPYEQESVAQSEKLQLQSMGIESLLLQNPNK